MFHLSGNTVLLGTTVDTDVPAITDDILTIQNNHYILDQPMWLLAAAAMSATLSRAKIASPTMRQVASPWIRPIIAATLPPTNPNMWLLDQFPFQIQPYEEIQVQATSAIAMGTERFTSLVWLGERPADIPVGNVYPLRWTSTTAAVANAWTTLSVTFADTLPPGIYSMVMSEHFSTNGIAHRWIIPNQRLRPGYLSFATVGLRVPYAVAKGQFGQMGRFRSNALPMPQVLANAADATHEGYLHVVRVGTLAA